MPKSTHEHSLLSSDRKYRIHFSSNVYEIYLDDMQSMAYWWTMIAIVRRKETEYWWICVLHIREWWEDLKICIVQLDSYDHFLIHRMQWSVSKDKTIEEMYIWNWRKNETYMPDGKKDKQSGENKCKNIRKCNECKSHVGSEY